MAERKHHAKSDAHGAVRKTNPAAVPARQEPVITVVIMLKHDACCVCHTHGRSVLPQRCLLQ